MNFKDSTQVMQGEKMNFKDSITSYAKGKDELQGFYHSFEGFEVCWLIS